MARQINLFIIYAREDKETKLQLLRHLNPFSEAFNLSIWHDDHIEPGQLWKPHIESRLNYTDIFLMLVSVDFMNSKFIKQTEFKAAIDRHKENKSIVIPVIIDYCQWDIDFNLKDYTFNLNELQLLPTEGKPIGDWRTPDQAYNNIAKGVREVIISMRKKLEQQELNVELENKKQTEAEDSMWGKARNQNTINAFEEYLKNYSTGKYSVEAAAAIKIINFEIEEAQRIAREDQKMKEEAEAKRKAEEQKLKEEAEAKRKAEEQRHKEEAEAKRKAEEQRHKEEAEAKRKAEEQRHKEEAEAKRKAEEQRLKEEAEAKRKAEEQRLKEEAEAKRKAEEQRLKEEAEVKRKAEEQRLREEAEATREAEEQRLREEAERINEEASVAKKTRSRKYLIIGAIAAIITLGTVGVLLFSNKKSEIIPDVKPDPPIVVIPVNKDSVAWADASAKNNKNAYVGYLQKFPDGKFKSQANEKIKLFNKEEEFSKLKIGDIYLGGIIVLLDQSTKSGLLAAPKDLPSVYNWNTAKKKCFEYEIGGDVSKGQWYLPDRDELLLLKQKINLNAARYWSSTEAQAGSAFYLRYTNISDSYKSYPYAVRPVRKFQIK